VIEVVEGCGNIRSSNLSKLLTKKETAILEMLILAHAVEGIDVSSPEYIKGLVTLMDFLANH
jgi:hypothetical protein